MKPPYTRFHFRMCRGVRCLQMTPRSEQWEEGRGHRTNYVFLFSFARIVFHFESVLLKVVVDAIRQRNVAELDLSDNPEFGIWVVSRTSVFSFAGN